jgi:hypothetical protein
MLAASSITTQISNAMTLAAAYLDSVIKRLLSYKTLAEGAFAQLEEKDFFFTPNETSNSISVIIRHMSGNMVSRWTNFLTEDGEKETRDRDQEFETPAATKADLLALWEKGWSCMMDTLRSLHEEDLMRTIYIRHEPLLAVDAINRQLAHYPHHVGQILYIAKMIRDQDWKSLSIPKGASRQFNQKMAGAHPGDTPHPNNIPAKP